MYPSQEYLSCEALASQTLVNQTIGPSPNHFLSIPLQLQLIYIQLKTTKISKETSRNLKIIMSQIYKNLTHPDQFGIEPLSNSTFWLHLSNILNLIDAFTITLEIESSSFLMTEYVAYLVKMMILSLANFNKSK